MNDTYTKLYQDFCDNTKVTFYLNSTSILLLFLFVIGPFKQTGFKNYLIQLAIILLLLYSLYINVISSSSLFEIKNLFINPDLAIVRNNFALNCLFTICIFLFIVYLSINMISSQDLSN